MGGKAKVKPGLRDCQSRPKKKNFFSELKEENKSQERSSLAGQETADDIDDDNIDDANIDDNIEDDNFDDANIEDDNIEDDDDDNFMQDLMDLKEEDFEEYDPG